MTISSATARCHYVVQKMTTSNCATCCHLFCGLAGKKKTTTVSLSSFSFSLFFLVTKKMMTTLSSCHHCPFLLLCRHEKMMTSNCVACHLYVVVLLL